MRTQRDGHHPTMKRYPVGLESVSGFATQRRKGVLENRWYLYSLLLLTFSLFLLCRHTTAASSHKTTNLSKQNHFECMMMEQQFIFHRHETGQAPAAASSPRHIISPVVHHQQPSRNRGFQFPWKLHDMLNSCAEEGLDHIVSWQPHGRAFRVNNRELFASVVMPRFFKQTKYKVQ